MDPNPELHENTVPQQQSQASGSGDGGSFDCNICLELAQDPVVTLCGHLFCWPCLYRWLQMHSISKECPVCKASVVEEKVIPLYGRGKVGSADPRTKAVPGVNIPHRPSGQRPDTARAADHHYASQGFNFMAGQGHMAAGSFGNITFSAGFGLFPSLFGFQMHGFADAPYGSTAPVHIDTNMLGAVSSWLFVKSSDIDVKVCGIECRIRLPMWFLTTPPANVI